MSNLFIPLIVGALELPHRIIMAPLTRARAGVPATDYFALNLEPGNI